MAEVKSIRLNKVLKEFNISLDRAVDYLKSKSIEIEARPTTKISDTEYRLLKGLNSLIALLSNNIILSPSINC